MRTSLDGNARRRGGAAVALAVAVGVVFLVGVWLLFQWRFKVGDVYPPGSSLRSDPLGGRVLYDTVEELPEFEVSRNYEPYDKLAAGGDATMLLMGASVAFMTDDHARRSLDALTAFVERGGRLVVAVNPGRRGNLIQRAEAEMEKAEEEGREKERKARQDDETAEGEDENEDEDEDEKEDEGEESESADDLRDAIREATIARVATIWGVGVDWTTGESKPENGWRVRRTQNFDELENAELPRWHSAMYFVNLNSEWETLGRVKGKPVLVRRGFGDGEIVIASDHFFSTNEALAGYRRPAFIRWLLQDQPGIVFDETHHGTVRKVNLVQLMGRFGLQGFFVGLALFVVLMAWRSGSSLLPGDDEMGLGITRAHEVSGQDAATGLRRLLRRSVRPPEFLEKSFEIWRQQAARLPRRHTETQLGAVRKVIADEKSKPKGQFDPVTAYRKIAKILGERI